MNRKINSYLAIGIVAVFSFFVGIFLVVQINSLPVVPLMGFVSFSTTHAFGTRTSCVRQANDPAGFVPCAAPTITPVPCAATFYDPNTQGAANYSTWPGERVRWSFSGWANFGDDIVSHPNSNYPNAYQWVGKFWQTNLSRMCNTPIVFANASSEDDTHTTSSSPQPCYQYAPRSSKTFWQMLYLGNRMTSPAPAISDRVPIGSNIKYNADPWAITSTSCFMTPKQITVSCTPKQSDLSVAQPGLPGGNPIPATQATLTATVTDPYAPTPGGSWTYKWQQLGGRNNYNVSSCNAAKVGKTWPCGPLPGPTVGSDLAIIRVKVTADDSFDHSLKAMDTCVITTGFAVPPFKGPALTRQDPNGNLYINSTTAVFDTTATNTVELFDDDNPSTQPAYTKTVASANGTQLVVPLTNLPVGNYVILVITSKWYNVIDGTFTFPDPPTFSGISPDSLTPGDTTTQFTISGGNFGASNTIGFVDSTGAIAKTITASSSGGTITFSASSIAGLNAGTYSLLITPIGGSPVEAGYVFTVLSSTPVITSFSPTSGTSGTQITINGQFVSNTSYAISFIDANGNFGGMVNATSNSSGQTISFALPSSILGGIYKLSIANAISLPVASAATFTVIVPVNGTCGTAATKYVYNATAFSGTMCGLGNGVTTPSSPAFPAQGSSTTWTCGGSNGGSSSPTCTAAREPAPPSITITSMSYSGAAVGTSLTISGTSFSTSGNTVKFTGVSNGLVASVPNISSNGTQIIVAVPNSAAGSYNVSVVNSSGSTGTYPSAFTILPKTTSFSPASGLVGTTLTITGAGYSATGNTVNFRNLNTNVQTNITNVSSSGGSTITVAVPSLTIGSYVVGVYSTGLYFSGAPGLFNVVAPVTITPTPTSGPIGTIITFTASVAGTFSTTAGGNGVLFNPPSGFNQSVAATSTDGITLKVSVPNNSNLVATDKIYITPSGKSAIQVQGTFTVTP